MFVPFSIGDTVRPKYLPESTVTVKILDIKDNWVKVYNERKYEEMEKRHPRLVSKEEYQFWVSIDKIITARIVEEGREHL